MINGNKIKLIINRQILQNTLTIKLKYMDHNCYNNNKNIQFSLIIMNIGKIRKKYRKRNKKKIMKKMKKLKNDI